MHMADALLSPAVGGTMWTVSAATIAYCSKKIRTEMDDRKIPLMGVLGAFIFAAQMINFTIPVTGSSGHLGGGLILSILLGPYAAFLTIASVLVVQAFFFADGGLLALGCNIFNLGFFPAFIAYPFIYKKIIGGSPSPTKISVASMAAAVIGLQLGAFGVVVETVLSGISALPFSTFLIIMQPIHLAIGVVEGLVTATVISFVYKAKPEIMLSAMESRPIGVYPLRNSILGFLAVTLLTGGVVSWFASAQPDGLEWSIRKVTGKEKLKSSEQGLHSTLATIQKKLAFLPDYSFKKTPETKPTEPRTPRAASQEQKTGEKKAAGDKLGTSISGLVGGMLTLLLSLLIGFLVRRRAQTSPI
ncbi:MAG: cobalamin biosynthesis protein CbiM [Proteobacteria bacterium]|nr:cobalamin biosynthesis protein CbiM [Pseudomonadota bacterium]